MERDILRFKVHCTQRNEDISERVALRSNGRLHMLSDQDQRNHRMCGVNDHEFEFVSGAVGTVESEAN